MGLSAPELTLLFDLWVAARRTGSILDEALAPTGMTATDYALYSLVQVTSPVTATKLSDVTGIPLQTISRMLRELEDAGHVDRFPNPDDARSTLVSLNRKGREVRKLAEPRFRETMAKLEAELATETEIVHWAIRYLNRALSRMQGEPVSSAVPEVAPSPHSIRYGGDLLTEEQGREVRMFINWIRQRDASQVSRW